MPPEFAPSGTGRKTAGPHSPRPNSTSPYSSGKDCAARTSPHSCFSRSRAPRPIIPIQRGSLRGWPGLGRRSTSGNPCARQQNRRGSWTRFRPPPLSLPPRPSTGRAQLARHLPGRSSPSPPLSDSMQQTASAAKRPITTVAYPGKYRYKYVMVGKQEIPLRRLSIMKRRAGLLREHDL